MADDDALVCGDRISCWVGSIPIWLGRKIGRDANGEPIKLRFPFWAVDAHAVVERIYSRGEGIFNDWEITCRPTMQDGEEYQTGDDFEESPDDDLIIVLLNTNAGREPDISEKAMTRAEYEAIDGDLAGWEESQREEDDPDPEPEPKA